MNYGREFDIAWEGLKEGIHHYKYKVNDRVLKGLGYNDHPDFDKLDVKVELVFEKENNFFQLHFDINGQANVICDRCGDAFDLDLWDEFDLIVKLAETEEKATALNREDDIEEAEVVFISRSETVLNVFQWVHDFIMLSFPIQKIHPDKENGQSGCNEETLRVLQKMKQTGKAEKRKDLWKGLEQFKHNIENN